MYRIIVINIAMVCYLSHAMLLYFLNNRTGKTLHNSNHYYLPRYLIIDISLIGSTHCHLIPHHSIPTAVVITNYHHHNFNHHITVSTTTVHHFHYSIPVAIIIVVINCSLHLNHHHKNSFYCYECYAVIIEVHCSDQYCRYYSSHCYYHYCDYFSQLQTH